MPPKPSDAQEKALWPNKCEDEFIFILHHHVKKGQLQTSTFKLKVWSEISVELFDKCLVEYTVPQLKSKFNRLRCAHREFSDLIGHTGFGWDPIANTVTAADDVWNNYIKSKPKVGKYRERGLKHYELLGEIFNTTTATGQLHYSSSQLPPNSDDERELEGNFINSGVHINEPVDVDIDEDGGDTTQLDGGRGKKKAATSCPSERRPKRWQKMDEYLAQCSEAMSKKLQRRASIEISSPPPPPPREIYSVEECIEIIEAMGNIDNVTYCKFVEKIVSVEYRKIFISMADERRRFWLTTL